MITWGERKSKFHATKVTIDGIVFDSKGEGARYQELILLQKAGHIKNLQLQVPFELQPPFRKRGKTYRAIHYVADFVYERDGVTTVEDFKGFNKEKTYLLKVKLFEYKFPALYLLETKAPSARKTNTVRTVVAKPKGAKKYMEGTQQWK